LTQTGVAAGAERGAASATTTSSSTWSHASTRREPTTRPSRPCSSIIPGAPSSSR